MIKFCFTCISLLFVVVLLLLLFSTFLIIFSNIIFLLILEQQNKVQEFIVLGSQVKALYNFDWKTLYHNLHFFLQALRIAVLLFYFYLLIIFFGKQAIFKLLWTYAKVK